jgi:hypothetical protein
MWMWRLSKDEGGGASAAGPAQWGTGGRRLISCRPGEIGAGGARRENAPESIAAMAFNSASFGVDESEPVTNSSTFTLSRPATMRGFPSERLTLARHLPGFCSNAFTINCLYSTADPRRIRSAPRTARVRPSRIQLNPRNVGGILLLRSWLRSSVTVRGVSWQRVVAPE